MSILAELRGRFRAALGALVDDVEPLLDMVRPAQDARFGDYQANCAMPLGKQLGKPPRDVAADIVERLELDDLCEPPEVAGPGFINLRLRDRWLVRRLAEAVNDQRVGVAKVGNSRTYVIDYSSPNVAKPMHVGHIRSTVIGDALCRALRFLGHRVISDNHLGDWGTQFGMIIYGYKHFVDADAYQQQPVAELSRLYRLTNQLVEYHQGTARLPDLQAESQRLTTLVAEREQAVAAIDDKGAAKKAKKELRRLRSQAAETADALRDLETRLAAIDNDPTLCGLAEQHPDIAQAVLQETARLHEGDAENRRLWDEFLPACRDDIHRVYERLDVKFDYEHGESFYQDRLAAVVDDFEQRGLARESEGATCVFLDGFETPMIIRKKDGAYLYATTDLATIQYRMEQWQPDALLYVVDHRQSEHFDKLFAAARLWGYEGIELRHISFGTVLGEDGRPFKTRAGDTIGLKGVLDEAAEVAYRVVSENDDRLDQPKLDDEDRRRIGWTIGLAAIKYADLSHNRTSDYRFSYEKMLALKGNTAPYMQYSYARTQSIFRKGQVELEKLRSRAADLQLHHPLERALAIEVLRFGDAILDTVADYRPNLLTDYLFTLAERFHEFYQHPDCLVLHDSPEIKTSRLLLCDLAGRTIRQGLAILGIDVVEQM